MKRAFTLLITAICCLNSFAGFKEDRSKAQKLYNDKNWQEAFDIYKKLAVEDKNTGEFNDLEQGYRCIQNLRVYKEFDEFVESSVKSHPEKPKVLQQAADLYTRVPHSGYVIDNKFERDQNWRNRAKRVNCTEKDRVRAIQLFYKAMKLNERNKTENTNLYYSFAQQFRHNRWNNWRMQLLTEFTKTPEFKELPNDFIDDFDDEFEDDDFGDEFEDSDFDDEFLELDYSSDYDNEWSETVDGAAVNSDGNPVFYELPESFESTQNDGERWRWLISKSGREDYELASFAKELFGVQTMASYSHFFSRNIQDDDNRDGIMAVHTLKDEETIAKLANGVKRFTLPSEYNFIKLYKKTKHWNELAQIYENRRQYTKALTYWKKYYETNKQEWVKNKITQIESNWCKLENSYGSQPAGKGAKVDLRFRNGEEVEFTAFRVDYKLVMDKYKKYIKANTRDRDAWRRTNFYNLGKDLLEGWAKDCLGNEVASWTLKLKPFKEHFDKHEVVTTPLQKAGLYLLKAKIKDGNESQILVWIDDTVIVKKNIDKAKLYVVTDAVTGQPLPKLNVEFFCYKDNWRNSKRNRDIRNFAEYTDKNGQIIIDDESLKGWQVTAIVDDKNRYSVLKNDYFNYNQFRSYEMDNRKTMVITDRPVYRPNQQVMIKAWIRQAKYDLAEDQSLFANQKFTVHVNNPRGEKVYEKSVETDEFGGFNCEFDLDENATLGRYSIQIKQGRNWFGNSQFRVEEYKKPEFEVKVEAPKEPLKLGDNFTAKVKANYYFGAPVTEAEVNVKVMRYEHDTQWFPYDPWDWCFGNGYWWFGENYDWYPGWRFWGCKRPYFSWIWRPQPAPELIANLKGHVNKDGEFEVKIDTALAKELYGNKDHRYEITAEVRDASRRTIVGSGKVIAARQPFKVYAWTDRGYYHLGDTVNANFNAQTVDSKPVSGTAEVTLYKISYNGGKSVEKAVKTWKQQVKDGNFDLRLSASTAGQFRLAAKVTDQNNNTIEGAHIFTVRGQGFDGKGYRYNDLEIIADKKNYQVGDTVKLVINTNQPDSTVYLFERSQNGVSTTPKVIRIDGKSTTYESEVKQADMPNFFVEAFTVSNAKIHTAVRQIVVPPQKRVLNVEVKPSGQKFKPGEKAKVKLRLTDIDGKPFSGTMALTVYDKSLEYIAASSTPNIKEFFWKWKRHYSQNINSSFNGSEGEIRLDKVAYMQFIGVFGHVDYDDFGDDEFADDFGDEDYSDYGDAVDAGRGTITFAFKGAPMSPMARQDSRSAEGVAMEMKKSNAVWAWAAAKPETSVNKEVKVRSEFADTAFWKAVINTDENGDAEVEFPMPENLTTWKIKTWGMGHGTKVGQGEAEVITSKDFIIRLQAPRFFVEKDEVVLSANIHNYLKTDQDVEAILELVGDNLQAMDELTRKVTVKANGELRVNWLVKAVKEGEVIVRMKAVAEDDADAMEMKFPVYVHGFDKMVPYCGVIRPEETETVFELNVPKDRRIDQTTLQVNFSPSLAMAMIDALPYMVEYPYGCTEQTLNKFLPLVITNKLLKDMNINLASLKDHKNNLNAQELGSLDERKRQWSKLNPVYDNEEVVKMTKAGVERLSSFQNSDGGWGWFGGDSSYPHTTAIVVRGLIQAKENGVAVIPRVLDHGIKWLENYQNKQLDLRKGWEVVKAAKAKGIYKKMECKSTFDNLDALIASILAGTKHYNKEVSNFLYKDREHLSVYGKCLAGLAFYTGSQKAQNPKSDAERLAMMVRNIRQFLKYDAENQTAYLENAENHYWWYWYGSDIEANAMFLKLLSKTEPKGKETAGLVKYLLNNRKHSTYWNSTRDTALCIEAFADYIRATGEDKPNMTVEVLLNDKLLKEVKIDSENLFKVDNTVKLSGKEVPTGKHKLTIRKKGLGPLYTNAYLNYFSLEDFITKAGLEVKVERRYYKLSEREKATHGAGSHGQVTNKTRLRYDRTKLYSLDEVTSGDLVEVELIVESKNDYEYIMIEDMKAAGFELVEINSGYNGNALGAYVEYRDEKVCFFTRWLSRGKHSVSYRLRAEVPGKFSALPTKIEAMYAPELRGNSDEMKLKIKDKR